MPTTPASTLPGTRYWRAARTPRYSLLFALPLLVLYETLAAVLPVSETHGVRNGADVILKSLFVFIAGPRGPLLFGVVLVGLCVWLIHRDVRVHGARLAPWMFGAMLVESLALALAFGAAVGIVTARLLDATGLPALASPATLDLWTQLMVSLGAGLYEELLFRVLLVSALALVCRRGFGWPPGPAGMVATVAGAAIFSAFHYVGPYGDTWMLRSFVFRFVGGLFFSAIYVLRGFGIVAWTHALYDVLLLVG